MHNSLRVDGVKIEHLKDGDVTEVSGHIVNKMISLAGDFANFADEAIDRGLPIVDLSSVEDLDELRAGLAMVQTFSDIVNATVEVEAVRRVSDELPFGGDDEQ